MNWVTNLIGLINDDPKTENTDENVHPNMAPGCAVSFSDANQSLKTSVVMFEDTLRDEKSAEGAQLKPTGGCTLPSATEPHANESNQKIESIRSLTPKYASSFVNLTLTHCAPVDLSSELDDTEYSFVSQATLENGSLDVSEIDSPKTEMLKVLVADQKNLKAELKGCYIKMDEIETKFETKIDEIETKNEDEIKSVHKKIDQTSEALTNVAEVADEKLDAVKEKIDIEKEERQLEQENIRAEQEDIRAELENVEDGSDILEMRVDHIEKQQIMAQFEEKNGKPKTETTKTQKKFFNFRSREKKEIEEAAPVEAFAHPDERLAALHEKRDNGQLYVAWVRLELEGKPSSAFGGNVYKALHDMNFRKVVGNGWDYDETEHRQYVFYSVRQALVLARATQAEKKANAKGKTKKNE
jgi:hypothetical protein